MPPLTKRLDVLKPCDIDHVPPAWFTSRAGPLVLKLDGNVAAPKLSKVKPPWTAVDGITTLPRLSRWPAALFMYDAANVPAGPDAEHRAGGERVDAAREPSAGDQDDVARDEVEGRRRVGGDRLGRRRTGRVERVREDRRGGDARQRAEQAHRDGDDPEFACAPMEGTAAITVGGGRAMTQWAIAQTRNSADDPIELVARRTLEGVATCGADDPRKDAQVHIPDGYLSPLTAVGMGVAPFRVAVATRVGRVLNNRSCRCSRSWARAAS